MAWFRKEKKPKEAIEKQTPIPEGLWIKCEDCKEIVYRKEVEANLSVCPKCGYHFRLDARERFAILFDDNNYKEFATNIKSGDPLEFRDTKKYRDRLKVYQTRVGPGDAVLCAEGKLENLPVVIAATQWGILAGILAAVSGTAAADFFFYPPLYSFWLNNPQDAVDLTLFLLVAIITSNLAARLKREAETTKRRAKEIRELYSFSQRLATCLTSRDLIFAAQDHLTNALGFRTILIASSENGQSALGNASSMPREISRPPPVSTAAAFFGGSVCSTKTSGTCAGEK